MFIKTFAFQPEVMISAYGPPSEDLRGPEENQSELMLVVMSLPPAFLTFTLFFGFPPWLSGCGLKDM